MLTRLLQNTPTPKRLAQTSLACALSLWGLLAPGVALATQDQACADFAPPPGVTAVAAAIEHMLPMARACQDNASYLATLGDLYIQDGKYTEAADHLERALMLNPDLKGAQLNYAIALAGVGDLQAAQALLDTLRADPAMPQHLRTALGQQKSGPNAPTWRPRWLFSGRWGADSNLLSAPNLTELALTLPSQTVVLPLDSGYLARSGQYYRTDAQLELRRLETSGVRWELTAAHHNWYSPVEELVGANQADILIERTQLPSEPPSQPSKDLLRWGHYVAGGLSSLETRTGIRYATAMLGVGFVWAVNYDVLSHCRMRAGLEAQSRNHNNNEVLSGRYKGFSSSFTCEPPGGLQWLLGVKIGQDSPLDPDRPGGYQDQSSLRAALVLPLPSLQLSARQLPKTATFTADFEVSHQQDESGYSPLLESGRSRTLDRYSDRLELQQPLTPASHWSIGFEAARQRASIGLFEVQSAGPYLAWRAHW